MGTLGAYLTSARESKGLDLHEAAQQTRISIHYLKAIEEEDFSKLPGEVFVKGFLKSYAKFLDVDEQEVVKRYQELRQPKQPPAPAPDQRGETKPPTAPATSVKREFPLEPLAWGALIFVLLVVFLFISIPKKHRDVGQGGATIPPESTQAPTPGAQPQAPRPEKLFLEIVALDDVWLLVRTDASPQKKAVLKKGESVIWSADERFMLSYGNAGAVSILLNGRELTVKAPKNALVRDLVITASGIAAQNIQTEQPKPKMKPQVQQQPAQPQQAPPAPQPSPVPAVPEPAPAAAVQQQPAAAPVPPQPPAPPEPPISQPRE